MKDVQTAARTRAALKMALLVELFKEKKSAKEVSDSEKGYKELRSRQFWRALLAEVLGSLIFVSAVLGSSVPGPADMAQGPLYPALAAGMVNPAVTLAFLATRRLDLLRAAVYILGQCLGATLGAALLYLLLPLKSAAEVYPSKVSSEGNAGQALGMEVLATFQLVFTIFSVEDQRRREGSEPGNLAIGFSLSAGVLTAGRFSGGSMNPARSLGPAIITGFWEHHWVYWIGPVLGSVLAGVSHEFFFVASASRQKLVACLTCKDIEIMEAASVSRSSLSTVTQAAMRAKQANKQDHN
ncbi:aquaporin-4-like [Scleropages formosus]|uniref:Aquaporin-4-like n=1 Tax=Scleropages formosus TaxID=113540 RepID=A0A0P7VHD0_SCLFO|nr:aquaporin-4-like [Scleropages formosus]